ncbi:MAG: spore germination protein [Eubacteriales bacterium]
MFGFISRKLNFHFLKSYNDKMNSKANSSEPASVTTVVEPIDKDLSKNIANVRSLMGDSSDLTIHEFSYGHERNHKGALVYLSSLTDKGEIHKNVLKPLMYDALLLKQSENVDLTDIDVISKNLLSISDLEQISLLKELLDKLLCGASILLVHGSSKALAINTIKLETRGVNEPDTESVVRGPREGFNECFKTGIALIRRKIKDPALCVEEMTIGEKSNTKVIIIYLKTVANPKIVEEVKRRLSRIKIDAILESGYIEEFIEDAPYSIFSTVSNSEKPDKVASKLLEGRVAILVDGTPFVLVVPMLFVESFQSSEDYYSRPFLSSIVRILRIIAFMLSILGPALYVALTVFHQELIPTQLLISIAAGHEKVPYPAILEAFLMIMVFDILREAGVRLPTAVGQTISIVGALVLGQAAVEAGLISPIMVIVVATTAISSFAVPSQTDSGTILRYIYLLLAGIAGGFGVIMGMLVTLMHLSSLRSFGVPYLWPIAPLNLPGLKDVFIRAYMWKMEKRPSALKWDNDLQRQGQSQKPTPKR